MDWFLILFGKVKYLILFVLLFFSQTIHCAKKGAEPVKIIGDVGQVALPLLAGSMTVVYRDWHGTLEFAKSFGLAMGVTYILKPMVNEDRPISSENRRVGRSAGNMSFPSGHTAAAFAGAAFLQMRYGWGFGIPCYLMAGYVGFSRVYSQKHWFMDVLGGASIALAANVLFTTRYSKRNYTIEPIIEEDRRGISLKWDL